MKPTPYKSKKGVLQNPKYEPNNALDGTRREEEIT
jgi:hypothetical protein